MHNLMSQDANGAEFATLHGKAMARCSDGAKGRGSGFSYILQCFDSPMSVIKGWGGLMLMVPDYDFQKRWTSRLDNDSLSPMNVDLDTIVNPTERQGNSTQDISTAVTSPIPVPKNIG